MADMTGLAQLLMQDDDTQARMQKMLGQGMQRQGANGAPVRSPMDGAGRLGQGLIGVMLSNPKMFQGLFGLAGGGPSPISPSAAMTAYGNMPTSYTMPGGGGG